MDSVGPTAWSARARGARSQRRTTTGSSSSVRIDRSRFGRRCRWRTTDEIRPPVDRRRRHVYVRVDRADRRGISRLRDRGALVSDRDTQRIAANRRRGRELATVSDRLQPGSAYRTRRRLRRRERGLRDGARRYTANDGRRRALDHDQDAGDRVAARSGRALPRPCRPGGPSSRARRSPSRRTGRCSTRGG